MIKPVSIFLYDVLKLISIWQLSNNKIDYIAFNVDTSQSAVNNNNNIDWIKKYPFLFIDIYHIIDILFNIDSSGKKIIYIALLYGNNLLSVRVWNIFIKSLCFSEIFETNFFAFKSLDFLFHFKCKTFIYVLLLFYIFLVFYLLFYII